LPWLQKENTMKHPLQCRIIQAIICLQLLFTGLISAIPAYDPLTVPVQSQPQILDLTVNDEARQREIPIRIYMPSERTPAPVVLFSHGLGGSRETNAFMGRHWAERGYVAVFVQHPGSDSSIWQEEPQAERMRAMQRAASGNNFLLRVKDIPAVLNQLEIWNHTIGHALAGRMDLEKVGMSGHSFGAMTTQALSGQKMARGDFTFTDQRIKAAIAFSPSSPSRGNAKQAFGTVSIPWLLMTGTNDVAPIGNADLESRLAVFPALPPGGKYELVLDKAEHSAFTDRALPGDANKRNPNHHRVILALSTAFWDTWLRGDTAARTWLDGQGPRLLLEKNDRWQRK
jgi:predicted dienelactone hydrolase